ncbi:MAG: CcdC protein domain-containing protein [Sphingomonas sp.]
MQGQEVQPHGWVSVVVPLLIVAVVMLLRVRRMRQLQPLKLERLWLVPALYGVAVVMLFVQNPPTPGGWVSALVALIAGGALGWQRGKLMRIHVDPETHALNQQASMAGIAFLLALIVVRYGAETAGGSMHMNVGMIVNTLAALALGMFSAQRLEMYLRAKRLLAEARAAKGLA